MASTSDGAMRLLAVREESGRVMEAVNTWQQRRTFMRTKNQIDNIGIGSDNISPTSIIRAKFNRESAC